MDWEPTEPPDNGEGPSETSPFYVPRKNTAVSNSSSSSDDLPITCVAQSARVIRRISPTGTYNGSADTTRIRMTTVARCSVDNLSGYATYQERPVVPSPFEGLPTRDVMEPSMAKCKGKAQMVSFRTLVKHMANAATDPGKGKWKGKGKPVEMIDNVNEAMGNLVLDGDKRPAATLLQRIDWSRLIRPNCFPRQDSEYSSSKLIWFPSWT
jgi:hypothetical protein